MPFFFQQVLQGAKRSQKLILYLGRTEKLMGGETKRGQILIKMKSFVKSLTKCPKGGLYVMKYYRILGVFK